MQRKNVGIIGYGRFGELWSSVLGTGHDVWVTNRSAKDVPNFVSLEELCKRVDTLFLCVPINQIEATLEAIKPCLRAGMTIADTCSVKAYPAGLMQSILGDVPGINLIATHPMFGPDSAANGVTGLPMTMWNLSGDDAIYREWLHFFRGQGILVEELSPDEHDRLAAYSQGITHYIGRVLGELDLQATSIDTRGFKMLLSLTEQTNNDTWELFRDLQQRNAHTQEMRLQLENALDTVYASLLPERVEDGTFVVGIQGGQGSFNEEACRFYCRQHAEQIPAFRLSYLYTTDNVLRALHRGEVDYGVFAIQNARGGVVMETIEGLSRYTCEILEVFDIVISHCILHHPGTRFDEIDTLISHPQALAQCSRSLQEKYGHLKQTSGTGDLIDQAYCAQNIAQGKLPRTTAVLASRVCADLYGLAVHDEGLQDLGDDNLTTFVWVQRRKDFHRKAE